MMPGAPSAAGMGGTMPGMDMLGADIPVAPSSTVELALLFAMWAVMMVGMMTPSVAPMILIYARVARSAVAQGRRPFAPSGWFAAGYLLAWSGFSAGATTFHAALDYARLLGPDMASASTPLGSTLLIVAGLYQWSPLKDSCLAQCRSPLSFIQSHGGFRRDARGALGLGLRHGFYCIGCCWPLMLLLFLFGVMNLLWIAALAALVLAEKVVSWGRLFARAAGLVMIGGGAAMAAGLI
jgi:predicted metal-binding membrane protein